MDDLDLMFNNFTISQLALTRHLWVHSVGSPMVERLLLQGKKTIFCARVNKNGGSVLWNI